MHWTSLVEDMSNEETLGKSLQARVGGKYRMMVSSC